MQKLTIIWHVNLLPGDTHTWENLLKLKEEKRYWYKNNNVMDPNS